MLPRTGLAPAEVLTPATPGDTTTFWSAALLAKAGRLDEARARLAFASETNPRWGTFLKSIAAAGVLPIDNPLVTGG